MSWMYRRLSVGTEVHLLRHGFSYLGPISPLSCCRSREPHSTAVSVAPIIPACPVPQTHRNARTVGKILPPQGKALWSLQFALWPDERQKYCIPLPAIPPHPSAQALLQRTGPPSLHPAPSRSFSLLSFQVMFPPRTEKGLFGPKAVLTLGWSSREQQRVPAAVR